MAPRRAPDIDVAINAGIDMVMVSGEGQPYKKFIRLLKENVEEGLIPMSRIDDAVTRILKVKLIRQTVIHCSWRGCKSFIS